MQIKNKYNCKETSKNKIGLNLNKIANILVLLMASVIDLSYCASQVKSFKKQPNLHIGLCKINYIIVIINAILYG